VGVGSNLMLYMSYLILTWLGIGHKSAMSGLYLIGMAQIFFLNKTWTFAYRGNMFRTLGRFFVAYAFGYLVNLWMLRFIADELGFPHQFVHGFAIPTVAVTLFLIQRYWVFPHHTHD